MALSKEAVKAALTAALAAPFTAKGPCGGCGRAYVVLTAGRPEVNAFAAACKAAGVTFLRKAYGVSGPALYCGYDNADGRALAKSEAVAASLNAAGLSCYADAVSD